MPSRLTEADRDRIDRARKLFDLGDPAAVREHTGQTDTAMAYAAAFGEAQPLLIDLASRLLELGGF